MKEKFTKIHDEAVTGYIVVKIILDKHHNSVLSS